MNIDCPAKIKDTHDQAAPGVEVYRQRHQSTLVSIHALGHAVIHAAQRIGFVVDAAGLRKSGGAGGDHEEEGIEALDFDSRITRVALNNYGFKKRRFDRLSMSGRR